LKAAKVKTVGRAKVLGALRERESQRIKFVLASNRATSSPKWKQIQRRPEDTDGGAPERNLEGEKGGAASDSVKS